MTAFSQKQFAEISRCMSDARDLLGADPDNMPMPTYITASIGLAEGTTYRAAFLEILARDEPTSGDSYTAAVMELRQNASDENAGRH